MYWSVSVRSTIIFSPDLRVITCGIKFVYWLPARLGRQYSGKYDRCFYYQSKVIWSPLHHQYQDLPTLGHILDLISLLLGWSSSGMRLRRGQCIHRRVHYESSHQYWIAVVLQQYGWYHSGSITHEELKNKVLKRPSHTSGKIVKSNGVRNEKK